MEYLLFAILIAFLVTAIFIASWIDTKSPVKLSPVTFFAGLFLVYNILAVVFYSRINSSNLIVYPYVDLAFFDEILASLNMNFLLLFWIILGHIFFVSIYRALPRVAVIRIVKNSPIRHGLLGAITMLSILAFVLYYGSSLITRQAYVIENESSGIRAILGMMVLMSAFLSGIISREKPIFGLVLVSIIVVILAAHGSRRAAVVPAIYFFGKYINGNPKITSFIVVCLASVMLFAVSLISRNLESQGFAHLLQVLDFSEFGALPVSSIYQYLINNALMGFPMSHYANKNIQIELQLIIASINPLPGFLAWDPSYNERLHIGNFFPINGMGTLHGAGYFVSALTSIYLGFLLSAVNRFYFKAVSQKKNLLATALLGLSALAAILFLQYGLRHAIRPLYYAALLGLALSVLSSLARSKRIKD